VANEGDAWTIEAKWHRRTVVDDDDRDAGQAFDESAGTRSVIEHRGHDRDIVDGNRLDLRVDETAGEQSTRQSSFGFAASDRRTADPAVDRSGTCVTEPNCTQRRSAEYPPSPIAAMKVAIDDEPQSAGRKHRFGHGR